MADNELAGRSSSLSAAQLQQALTLLEADERLEEVLGGSPLDALVVVAEGGGLAIAPKPEIWLNEAARQIVAECVQAALTRAHAQLETSSLRDAPAERRASTAGPNPHVIAARSHLEAGNPGRALEIAQSALARWPESTELRTYHALSLNALGHLAEAAQAFREVIRLDPESAFAHGNLGHVLGRLGRWQEALESAEAGLKLAPDDPVLLHTSALAKENLGRYEDAKGDMERALSIDPSLPGGPSDLQRIETSYKLDAEICLLDEHGTQSDQDTDELDVELVEEQAVPAGERADGPAPQPPGDEGEPDGDARWAVASHRSAGGPEKVCEECGATNPSQTAFCVQCGRRMD